MSVSKKPEWCRVTCLVAFSALLASCGGPDDASIPRAALQQTNPTAYAYLATANTLTTYSIASTGGLVAVGGSPLMLPGAEPLVSAGIVQVTTDPSGQFLYVLDQTSGVYAYAINADTGALTAVAGSPFASPGGSTSLAFDASGNYLYVAGETSPAAPVNTSIWAYSVEGSGALVRLTSYTIPNELSTIATSGSHVYIAGFYTNSITVFSIGPSGQLSEDVPGSPFATDVGPYGIAIDPSGSVLYTANSGTPTATEAAPGSISAFTIDASTGALTSVPGNPQPIAAHPGISIDPMGRFLFAPETNGVAVYAINTATGVLSQVAGSPFSAGANPHSVSVDPTSQTVYVLNGGAASVSEFALGSAGTLTPLTGSPIAVGTNPCCMAIIGK